MIGKKRRAKSMGGNGEAERGKTAAPNCRLCRTTFSASRLLDFCSIDELVKQTGHSPTEWPLVILKELVDNALDACEEAGVAPIIEVVVDGDGIAVSDNGPGIPASTVESLLDYHVRTIDPCLAKDRVTRVVWHKRKANVEGVGLCSVA